MKRKWLIAVIILAIVAVVLTIVFINLFKEKDTKELASFVDNKVENGYLSDESDQFETIDKYLNNLNGVLTVTSEKNEVANYQKMYQAYTVVGEFYNSQFVYTHFTDTYKNQRKKVEENLNKAQAACDSLVAYINDNKELVSGSDFWEAATWPNCKDYMKDMVSYTVDAFSYLSNIYEDSMKSKYLNNDLTEIIFNAVDDLATKARENVQTETDSSSKLLVLVNNYLVIGNESMILNYVYQPQTIIDKVANIAANGSASQYYADFLQGRIYA